MDDAVKSTQELKNRLSSAHKREQVFMKVILHDQSHDQSLTGNWLLLILYSHRLLSIFILFHLTLFD